MGNPIRDPYCSPGKKLKLYNGHNVTDQSSLIQVACSLWLVKSSRYVSSGNQMAIQYQSGIYPEEFEIAVGFTYGEKQRCGGTIYMANVSLPYILQAPDVDRDGKYEPLLSCDWLILAPEAHQIQLKVDRLDIQNCTTNSTCSCDYLEIHDGDNEGSTVMQRLCGTLAEPNVFTSTLGSVLVHFFSDGSVQHFGFQISITSPMSPCGMVVRPATTETQVLESPTFAGEMNQACLWTIRNPQEGSLLEMRLTHVNLPSPCVYNYMTIQKMFHDHLFPFLSTRMSPGQDDSGTYHTIGKPLQICGNRSADISMSAEAIQIKFSSNRAGPHTGFRLEYKIKKDCTGNFTAPFGRVMYNNRPQSNGTCYNFITNPQPNVTISVYFGFLLCNNRRNSDSGIKLYDGPNEQATEVASYCDRSRPNPVFSTGPSLYIVLKNMQDIFSYDITYTSTDQGRGCGGRFENMAGTFSSPLYPAIYKKNSACRWDVSVLHGNKIFFYFRYFDLGPRSTCDTNYIQMYDVDSKTGLETVHSRHCGQDEPAEIQMTGDTAVVRYFTTIHNNGSGWVLEWKSQSRLDSVE